MGLNRCHLLEKFKNRPLQPFSASLILSMYFSPISMIYYESIWARIDAIDPEKEMSQRTELMRLKKKSQKL
jgi:hypothetical protein